MLILLSIYSAHAAPMTLHPLQYGMGQITIPCDLDGEKLNCFVDTGSQITTVSDESIFKDYASIGEVVSMGASGNRETESLIKVKSAKFDTKIVNDAKVVRTRSVKTYPLPLLGMDLLRSDFLLLDFKKKALLLDEEAKNAAALYKNSIKMTLAGGYLPMLSMNLKREKAKILFDTGAAMTFVDASYVERYPDQFESGAESKAVAVDTTENETELNLVWMKRLKIGRIQLKGMWVVVSDLTPLKDSFGKDVVMLLGYNAISQANWLFDFSKSTVKIQ